MLDEVVPACGSFLELSAPTPVDGDVFPTDLDDFRRRCKVSPSFMLPIAEDVDGLADLEILDRHIVPPSPLPSASWFFLYASKTVWPVLLSI